MHKYFASIPLMLLVACGGDPLEPGSGHSGGGGTNTLYVEGRASAEARFSNAATPNDYDVEFRVRLSLNSTPVTTGTVTMKSLFVSVPLVFEQIDGTMGEWVGRAGAYDESYQLDVTSGPDSVTGVIVDGPDIHTFGTPLSGATLDSTLQNNLTWNREDVADVATFRTDGLDRITIADSGSYMVSPGVMKAEKDQAIANQLEIRRMNHIKPSGAISGSDFAVTIENHLDVVVMANPLLP